MSSGAAEVPELRHGCATLPNRAFYKNVDFFWFLGFWSVLAFPQLLSPCDFLHYPLPPSRNTPSTYQPINTLFPLIPPLSPDRRIL